MSIRPSDAGDVHVGGPILVLYDVCFTLSWFHSLVGVVVSILRGTWSCVREFGLRAPGELNSNLIIEIWRHSKQELNVYS